MALGVAANNGGGGWGTPQTNPNWQPPSDGGKTPFQMVAGGLDAANQWVHERLGTADSLAKNSGKANDSSPTSDPYAGINADPLAVLREAYARDRAAAQYSSNFRGALDFYNSFNAPTMAEYQAKVDRGNMNIGGILANQTVQTNTLRDNFDIAKQKLGLQRQGLGIDRNAAGRQITNADVLEELANQLYGNQMQGYGVDRREAWQTADQAQRAANSSATARGAMSAPGIGRTRTDIRNQLANTGERIGIGESNAGINLQQQKVGFNEQRASAKDRQAQIDLLSKGLGLDQKTLENNLDAQLSSLGLDTMMSVNDVFDMIGSTNINMNQLGIQILQEAFNAAGLNIDFATMFPGLGAGKADTSADNAAATAQGNFPLG